MAAEKKKIPTGKGNPFGKPEGKDAKALAKKKKMMAKKGKKK